MSRADNKPLTGTTLSDAEALSLADTALDDALLNAAASTRDQGFGDIVSFSKKVFIPLTELCRDVCHYCTFAKSPRRVRAPFMSLDDTLKLARDGAALGCKEALFTLGEKPELRYNAARHALAALGFESTIDYVEHVAGRVLAETGLLPHINAGNLTRDQMQRLRAVSGSMGLMLESASGRLCQRGMPHFGSPDKQPATRLQTIALAGELAVPFTSGILIGIGETRRERIESLLALRALHHRFGHIQEIIIQGFRAKAGTQMAQSPEPDLDDVRWTIAVARLIMGPQMSIQTPPNLNPGALPALIDAGINDWGGISPLTPDHVNPEAPWPHLDELADETATGGKHLDERLTVYPAFVQNASVWIDPAVRQPVARLSDGAGFARSDNWSSGSNRQPPSRSGRTVAAGQSGRIGTIIDAAMRDTGLTETDIELLFTARGRDVERICEAADSLRQRTCGDTVSYVVNRNINYTNICSYRCGFCAFSKGKTHDDLRGKPYNLPLSEIAQRVDEARRRGATEVCMQGGIHPSFDGNSYIDIVRAVRSADSAMHIHAFSPLEILHGATTLGLTPVDFLGRLRDEGLSTLPGTAAEILDDDVRAILCPDKLTADDWEMIMRAAHGLGLRTTATMMFGHVDSYASWARHLLRIRRIQLDTAGFTEFVPLPFVADEAPIYRRLPCRRGPTFREVLLVHAVSRLVFNGLINNIQTSWVKLGELGVRACLRAGANDLGGTLMDESITRAAGADNGQEFTPARMQALIRASGRTPQQRSTLYQPVGSPGPVLAGAV